MEEDFLNFFKIGVFYEEYFEALKLNMSQFYVLRSGLLHVKSFIQLKIIIVISE